MDNFYKGKKVFITGHTGFKGSWLALWLANMGAQVTGYALEPVVQPNIYNLCNVKENIKSIIGDIRNQKQLYQSMFEAKPEIVFHLAAQALVPYGYEYPVETFETNVMGTVNILESVRRIGSIKSVILVTTDKCYRNQESFWGYRENDPLGGYDPYSSSKACSELVIEAYRNSYFNKNDYKIHGVGIASVRAGNVIGGGDFSEKRLIPDIVKSILSEEEILLRNPNAIRPWQHVLEPLSGYLELAKRLYEEGGSYSEAWNFGPTDTVNYSVKNIVDKMINLWGKTLKISVEKNSIYETNSLKLDVYKANQYLGYKSRLTMDETLEWVVEWYQKYESDALKLKELTMQQIQFYSQLMVEKR